MSEMETLVPAPQLGIPEVKPAIESIRGRWQQKVSGGRRHSILQGRLWLWLTLWGRGSGEVGTEWRFYMLAKGEKPSSLVPDVAYVSFERNAAAVWRTSRAADGERLFHLGEAAVCAVYSDLRLDLGTLFQGV
jgi:hypothetical protein